MAVYLRSPGKDMQMKPKHCVHYVNNHPIPTVLTDFGVKKVGLSASSKQKSCNKNKGLTCY